MFCFSNVSYSVRRTFNQPTETSFLLLDFSFRKDLVHNAAQIVLFLVTPVLFRLSAAEITLPGPLEHHPINLQALGRAGNWAEGKAKRPVDTHLGPPFHGTRCASDSDASSYWQKR